MNKKETLKAVRKAMKETSSNIKQLESTIYKLFKQLDYESEILGHLRHEEFRLTWKKKP
jgi:hypothetical protein